MAVRRQYDDSTIAVRLQDDCRTIAVGLQYDAGAQDGGRGFGGCGRGSADDRGVSACLRLERVAARERLVCGHETLCRTEQPIGTDP